MRRKKTNKLKEMMKKKKRKALNFVSMKRNVVIDVMVLKVKHNACHVWKMSAL